MVDALLQATGYAPGDSAVDVRAVPTGGLVVANWFDMMVARGFGWQITVGEFTTGIVGGGAGTTLLDTDPELVVQVSAGQTLVPLRISIQLETPLTNADDDESEALITVDRTQNVLSVDADGTVEVPMNMRTDIVSGAPFTAVSANVGATPTTMTRSFDLAHRVKVVDVNGSTANALWGEIELIYEPKQPLFIVGPATLGLYWGGTVATSGFAQVAILSIPSNLVDDLV